jgi:1-acyl-sn-glycerol-3-phosphate acyltransferase
MPRESLVARCLWLPVNAVQLVFTLTWSAFWISVALVAAVFPHGDRTQVWIARRVWAPGLVHGAGARLVVTGLERLDPGRAHLVVANHSSWIDIAALYMASPVPLRFLAKRELAAVPFLGWYIRAMGMVFVDRRDPRRAHATVDHAQRLLESGRSVVSFPEGTRSRDGRVGRFKSGGFGAALAAGADVLPVGLVGAGSVLPPDGFKVRPGTIEVRIGEPIPTCGLARHDRAALARRAEDAVRALVARDGPAAARPAEP